MLIDKTFKKIQKQIEKNIILLYMKGSPKLPMCGFSFKAFQILQQCTKNFSYIDVLENKDIRIMLPKFSNWPTFPQLWINKKLIGGCDTITEMFNCNELQILIKNTLKKENKNTIC
ncbi:MAG: glutaredoxin 4 [Candidatus Westeberhardia cardiocondylae]|nr:glutaredoxin 4 [Candidatus Westeberhardia cardiocondylae]